MKVIEKSKLARFVEVIIIYKPKIPSHGTIPDVYTYQSKNCVPDFRDNEIFKILKIFLMVTCLEDFQHLCKASYDAQIIFELNIRPELLSSLIEKDTNK